MNKLDVFKYLLESNTALSISQIILSMCLAFVLSFFMYFVYRVTYRGTVYSKNFNQTLVLVAVIVTVVMSIIGSNLALSLGMVGSLSIIRFRTAIKEPRDIAFIFWAIAIGLSCGSEIYIVGIIGSITIALILTIFNFDIYTQNSYLLVIEMSGEIGKIGDILKQYTNNYRVRTQNFVKACKEDEKEVTFELSIRDKKLEELLKKLGDVENIKKYNLISFNGEIVG